MSRTKHLRFVRLIAQLGLFSVVLAAGSLFATSDVGATSLASQIAQLQSQEANLRSQLASLQGQASQADQQAAATQQQVAQAQAELAQEQQQLNRADAALATTNDQVARTQAQIVVDRAQLASLVTQMYQHGSSDNLSSAIANSSGVSQFVDNTLQLQTVGQQFSALTSHLLSEENSLQSLKASQTRQQEQVSQLVSSLQAKTSQLQAEEASFNAAASSLSGQAGQIATEIQNIAGQISTLQSEEVAVTDYGGSAGAEEGTILSTSAAPSPPYATPGDPYPWGQCTWYVATQTYVPWAPMGNADQWVGLDIQSGAYSVGATPRVGSMVVFRPGGAYDPYYGHVAWVVQVLGPDSFVVREGNFLGLGEVATSAIYTLQGVEGFIYG
ncbi:MAG: CHAP domain-containing protein [Candidatus Dormibacteraeota bacterium]|nr:CHAP domain-containing protein [Candidatus Dormibacteraeota bacterium]